jgi:hypothetical protein
VSIVHGMKIKARQASPLSCRKSSQAGLCHRTQTGQKPRSFPIKYCYFWQCQHFRASKINVIIATQTSQSGESAIQVSHVSKLGSASID